MHFKSPKNYLRKEGFNWKT